jgi:hypothetical protein
VALSGEQLHEVGLAVGRVESAIRAEPDAFRVLSADHAHVVGDMIVFALARKGFVVSFAPEQAARIAAEYEREVPEGRPS